MVGGREYDREQNLLGGDVGDSLRGHASDYMYITSQRRDSLVGGEQEILRRQLKKGTKKVWAAKKGMATGAEERTQGFFQRTDAGTLNFFLARARVSSCSVRGLESSSAADCKRLALLLVILGGRIGARERIEKLLVFW